MSSLTARNRPLLRRPRVLERSRKVRARNQERCGGNTFPPHLSLMVDLRKSSPLNVALADCRASNQIPLRDDFGDRWPLIPQLATQYLSKEILGQFLDQLDVPRLLVLA